MQAGRALLSMAAGVVRNGRVVNLLLTVACACGGGSTPGTSPAITRFEATPSWGEAPLETELAWELDSPEGAARCEIDVQGDGVFDEVVSPCPQAGSVPSRYVEWGKFEPVLKVVPRGGDDLIARTVVYSNHLVFADGVIFPESLATVVGWQVTADTVALTYDRAGVEIATGSIVWGTSGPGYIRRVVGVAVQGTTVTMTTQPAALEDAVTDGFFGINDALLPLSGATCVADCPDGLTIETIEAEPGSRAVEFEQRLRFTFPRFEYPTPDPRLELTTLQVDLGIRATVEIGIVPPRFRLAASPEATLRGTASVAGMISHPWSLGKITIGVLPVGPFVFTVAFDPEVELSAQLAAEFEADFSAIVAGGGDLRWTSADGGSATVSGTAHASFIPRIGFSLSGETELAARLPLEFQLMGAAGPYVGTEVRLTNTGTIGAEKCVTLNAALAAYAGAEIDLWHFRITIARFEATVLDAELIHECWPSPPVDAGVDAPQAPCTLPWGGTIPDGGSVTAYSTPSVPCGGTCTPQTRMCNNGVLSGTHTSRTCSVQTCPTSCALPWGGTIADGTSVTAYQASSVPCGDPCVSQTRTCNAGTLSGAYTQSACSVQGCAAACSLPWGGSTPDGTSVTAYQSLSVPCGNTCMPQTRVCSNGTLSGAGTSNSCFVQGCPAGYVAYGCAGASYVPSCTSNCYACTTQTGFFAYNDGGCSGLTCFNRFPGYGTYNGNPLVVMFTRSGLATAHARFFFADAAGNATVLNGNYNIYASVPGLPPASPTSADPTCAWSLDTATQYTLYNNAMPAGVMQTANVNQATASGTGQVLLFSGNLTGASYITVTNHWPGHTSCGQILLDYIEAVPL